MAAAREVALRRCALHPTPGSDAPGAFADARFRRKAKKKKEKTEKETALGGGLVSATAALLPPPRLIRGKGGSGGGGEDEQGLWWGLYAKTDATYQRPKASINLLLVTPEASEDPVHASLLARLLTHQLQQRLYYANCAGLGGGVATH